jgi:predicted aconitase with swiveling domain
VGLSVTDIRILVAGEASGEILILKDRLSFWGGIDPATGEIVDVHHPQRGVNLAGKILVMPGGRGSSSSSSVLAEAIRAGTAPAAIILREPDVALGAIVVRELYGIVMPVVVTDAGGLRTGGTVSLTLDRSGMTIST